LKRPKSKTASKEPAVKAHATAKVAATYEVQKKVTQHIPDDVTRARTGAWLTLISPITQWAGLRGDQLAHKRELLRIQQEEALAEIACRAAPRIAKLRRPIAPVPLKFLVPFLEKASLEEPDSPLIDMWSNLLVRSAENYDPHYVYFANLISQFSSKQASIFAEVVGPEGSDAVLAALERIMFGFIHDFIRDNVMTFYNDLKSKPETLDAMSEFIDEIPRWYGVEVEHIDLDDMSNDDNYIGYRPSYSKYDDKDETDFAILCGMRLLDHVDTGFFVLGERWKVKVLYYAVTPLGLAFAKACGVKSPLTD
jgi:hypothetical protein